MEFLVPHMMGSPPRNKNSSPFLKGGEPRRGGVRGGEPRQGGR